MTVVLSPYPAYRESGIEWLGQLPVGWETPRIKRVARLNPSKSEIPDMDDDQPVTFVPMEKLGSDGSIDGSGVRPFGEVKSGLTYFREGDLLLAKITPCFENGKSAVVRGLKSGFGFGSTEYHVIRADETIAPEFLYRIVSSKPFLLMGEEFMEGSAGQKRVPTDFVANLRIPVPPLDEQRAIANFLDAMDARITRFIAARKKMIRLLEEKKQAVINQAVTKGLDPTVPMKDSGVDWLGEIPAHWDVMPVKRELRNLNTRRVPLSSTERGLMTTREYDYYGASGVIDKVDDYLFDGDYLLIAEDGANLVLRNLPLAIVAKGKFWVNNHAHILAPIAGVLDFYDGVLESVDYRPWISGAAQPKLTQDRLMNIEIPVPPVTEQRAIADHIRCETSRAQNIVARHRQEIELMQEYRTRLISDVVTGKLDVRGVELGELPHLPPCTEHVY